MQTQDFEHLTRREWRELLRWRAGQSQIALDQAVSAKRKAIADYQTEGGATMQNWTGLRRAVQIETEARQKYQEARGEYCNPSSSELSRKDVPLLSLL